MTSYLAKRLAMAIFTVYVVVSLSFFMVRLMPGNAMELIEAQLNQEGGLSPEEILAKVRAIYGIVPNGPLWKQYLQYIGNAFRGDLGNSITNPGVSVVSIIAGALPWTVLIISISLLISFVLGLILGTIMATYPRTWFAKLTTGVTSFLSAIPVYLVAIVLLYFFADQHAWFPLDGAFTTGVPTRLQLAVHPKRHQPRRPAHCLFRNRFFRRVGAADEGERRNHPGSRLRPGGRVLGPVEQTSHAVVHRAQLNATHGDQPGPVGRVPGRRVCFCRDLLQLSGDRLLLDQRRELA